MALGNSSLLLIGKTDRTKVISKSGLIEAWTGFHFKGRAGAYSSMQWNKAHFTGVDYDNKSKTNAVWRFEGKKWAYDVDEELGNYDYLYLRAYPPSSCGLQALIILKHVC